MVNPAGHAILRRGERPKEKHSGEEETENRQEEARAAGVIVRVNGSARKSSQSDVPKKTP
jgi:hypothetical protein